MRRAAMDREYLGLVLAGAGFRNLSLVLPPSKWNKYSELLLWFYKRCDSSCYRSRKMKFVFDVNKEY